MTRTVAIIGANVAGCCAAEALRVEGYDGRIILIGEEDGLPYDRPALSKACLASPAVPAEPPLLFPEPWYADYRIDLVSGVRAVALDLAARRIELARGDAISADHILLATGARARRLALPGADAGNVHYLRTRDEALRLATVLTPGAQIVVIGMGVTGAEVASMAIGLGCSVTAIEPMPVPMQRVLGSELGLWLADVHRQRGVAARYGVAPAELELSGGRVVAVRCTDDSRIECDAVVVNIGADPAQELAAAAGIAVGNGICVNASCETSVAEVLAAGDAVCQLGPSGAYDRRETVQNAAEQGRCAAWTIMGMHDQAPPLPGFYTEQYGLNIQGVGCVDGAGATMIIRGDPGAGAFTAIAHADGRVVGALAVGQPRELAQLKRMIRSGARYDAAALADRDRPLTA